MLFLILATIASAGNGLTMKFAGARSGNKWSLLLFNYLAATVLSGLAAMRAGLAPAEVMPHEAALGVVTGVLFITAFALLQLNVLVNGATVSSSLNRMGAIIPMLLSIVLFAELPSVPGWFGIAAAVVAIVLLSVPGLATKPDANPKTQKAPSTRHLLILMVLASGTADTMSKVFEVFGSHAHEEAFILTTFGTALVICLVMLLRSGEKPAPIDLACGTMLGLFNYFSSDLMLRALMELPAYAAYTGFSTGVVLLTYVANALFMHEELTRRDRTAIAFILVALALINLT